MKDKIIYWLKLFLLIHPSVAGYTFVYMLVWASLGLPQDWWTLPLLAAMAGLSEWLFLKWVGRWEDDE